MGDSKLSFSVQLWDGFDVVITRLTKGRHDVKECKRYMEERALTEDVYAKTLKKTGQHFKDFEEKTSLSASWIKTLNANEQIAKHHEQLAVVCTEIAQALDALSNEIKACKSRLLASNAKLQAEKKKRMLRHDTCKKSYYEAVKQAETATINLQNGKDQNLPDKSLQKLERTKKTQLKLVDDSHDAYKKSVTSLQEIQEECDKTMALMLQELEVLETKRLSVLKDQNQRFSQSHDFLKSAIEQMAVLLKEGVSAIKLEQDIQDFIKANISGKSPPAHVQYQPQASDTIGHMVDGKSGGTAPVSQIPAPPSSSSSSLGTTTTTQTISISKPPPPTSASTFTAPTHVAHPPSQPPSAATTPKTSPMKELKKPPPPATEQSTEHYAKALYDFESEEPDDLPFVVDSMIKLLVWSDTDDWWQGELNGRRGMFPKNYVEKCGPPGSKKTGSVSGPPQPVPSTTTNTNQSAAKAGSGSSTVSSSAPVAQAADAPKVMNAKCEALFDFDGQDNDDLPFKRGDTLIITGELDGWFLGKTTDGTRTGIFPSNYVKIIK